MLNEFGNILSFSQLIENYMLHPDIQVGIIVPVVKVTN